MPKCRLIYMSTAIEEFTAASLRQLVDQAAEFNSANDITGVLFYGGGHFIQVLEGEASIVEALFERIKQDPRHTWIELLQFDRIDNRLFPDWSMELCNFDETQIVDHQELRAIGDFLTYCQDIHPDDATRGILRFFTSRLSDTDASKTAA